MCIRDRSPAVSPNALRLRSNRTAAPRVVCQCALDECDLRTCRGPLGPVRLAWFMRREVHRFGAGTRRPRDDERMAYDIDLAERIRAVVQTEPGLTEKSMFGGLAFLIDGNMAVSASSRGGLLLRVDPAKTESLASEPHVGRFEMRGREMDGWLRVDAGAVEGDDDLLRWVSHGVIYARSLRPN